ncbi:MAG: hypothetical protein ACR2HN_03870 [Tepidiformaceae bacterium]
MLVLDVGQGIGRPAEILVDPARHQVSLVVMTQGAVPGLSVVIPAAAIEKLDLDALTVRSMKDAHLAVHDPALLSKLEAGLELRRRPIFTKDGRRLGNIDGVEVDGAGNVTSYRVRKPRLGLLRPRQILGPADVGGLGAEFAVATPPDSKSSSKDGEDPEDEAGMGSSGRTF